MKKRYIKLFSLNLLPAMVLSVCLVACGSGGSNATSAPPSVSPPVSDPTPEPTTEPDVPTGENIISESGLNPTFNSGSGAQPVGTVATVLVDHDKFNQALEVDITHPNGVVWDGQLTIDINQDIAINDVLLLHLYFRTINTQAESGAGFTTVYVQGPAPDYEKFVYREITSTDQWVEYFIPMQATSSFNQDQVDLFFGVGGGDRPQKFQIGGIELINYHSDKTLADLPNTRPSYAGRELDAPWRAEAKARIEQYRKGDFNLSVKDSEGNPLPNQEITVNFKQHAYHFGTAIVGHRLVEQSEQADQYRAHLKQLFNQASPENDLKWGAWEGEFGGQFTQQNAIAGLQWLKDNDFYARGHVLVWPSKRNLPDSMQQYLPDDPANADPAAKQAVLDHIDDVTSATAYLLEEWDVLNEPFDNHYLMDAFGDQVMIDWFKRARSNLPSQKLYINDYGILSSGGRNTSHQNHYLQTIQYLLDNGAPLNGFGLQSHFGDMPTDIPTLYNIVDRFAKQFPDLEIRITEFDVDTSDEALQGDYTRDFLTMMFSHPSTVGIQVWGFWAGNIWKPDAAMFDMGWRAKPSALAWQDLVLHQWWNDFSGTTDANGQFAERGFYGQYQAKVNVNGKDYTFDFKVEANNDYQNSHIEWQLPVQ